MYNKKKTLSMIEHAPKFKFQIPERKTSARASKYARNVITTACGYFCRDTERKPKHVPRKISHLHMKKTEHNPHNDLKNLIITTNKKPYRQSVGVKIRKAFYGERKTIHAALNKTAMDIQL